MDTAPIDAAPAETQPVDPDREWTVWALGTLRELVDIDMRTARRLEGQHIVAGNRFEPPVIDFALSQARIARAVRLTIAMTERIREAYRTRKDAAEKAAAEVQERRQRRRAQVARAVAEELGPERPAGAKAAAAPRESLTETEPLDVELDTLPIDEIVRRICRRLGREPGRLPQGWDEVIAGDEAAEPLDEALTDPPPEAPEPGEPAPPARKPDSS
ncbi:hypothetical protein E9232_000133 [Inquilinus ginsengisoli]|uniref:Uncharacterized protein n=1 Tax=Inquilinus ginsengisoli TaxID=363840 RepID=A0ABU1JG88_9PROT|nr:hypothetical protein [Inquilinus ginsengisoli]MDR6287634.1 hypothetical protein [Inquilinus ginsengisoli]